MSARISMCVGLLWSVSVACQADVTVSGDVRTPGVVALAPGARLLDAIIAARPDAQGYWLAAAWLRRPLLEPQARLKAGVLFDLDTLRQSALSSLRLSRASLAAGLYRQVLDMPVTGRQRALLDPVAVETGFARNDLVSDGDQLIYPQRPQRVRIFGAVSSPCTVDVQPLQQARDYLDACPPLADADADYLWVIQPDGQTRRLGIAAWNREDGFLPVAGSTLLVPIRSDDLDAPTPDLNQQLAEFLATQPLAEVTP